MKAYLERMCNIIDEVLAGHGLGARVAGGYVAGNGLLFSLTDTTFLDTHVRLELKEALQVARVLATVGVVLVNDRGLPRKSERKVIEGSCVALPARGPLSPRQVETVDVLDLIAAHEADMARGKTAVSRQKGAAPSTRPL